MSFPQILRFLTLAAGLSSAVCLGQLAQPDFLAVGAPVSPAPPDPAIARALQAIEPAHIEQTLKALVSFGNRSTHSSMEKDLPPGQGITAAADWIAAQFEQISTTAAAALRSTATPSSSPLARASQSPPPSPTFTL